MDLEICSTIKSHRIQNKTKKQLNQNRLHHIANPKKMCIVILFYIWFDCGAISATYATIYKYIDLRSCKSHHNIFFNDI